MFANTEMRVTPLNEAARRRRCVVDTGAGIVLKADAFVIRRSVVAMLTGRERDVCQAFRAGRSLKIRDSFQVVVADEATDPVNVYRALEEPALTLFPVFDISPLSSAPATFPFVPRHFLPGAALEIRAA